MQTYLVLKNFRNLNFYISLLIYMLGLNYVFNEKLSVGAHEGFPPTRSEWNEWIVEVLSEEKAISEIYWSVVGSNVFRSTNFRVQKFFFVRITWTAFKIDPTSKVWINLTFYSVGYNCNWYIRMVQNIITCATK